VSLTNAQARSQYPETIVDDDPLTCNWQPCRTVEFLAGPPDYPTGGVANLKVHYATEEAFRALATIFRTHSYEFREKAGGTVNCRVITGGSGTSLHAHAIAFDINPKANPYQAGPGASDFDRQPDILAAVLAVRTVDGRPVFVWGGNWNNRDTMHFQPTACTRTELEAGIDWTTVDGGLMGLTAEQIDALSKLTPTEIAKLTVVARNLPPDILNDPVADPNTAGYEGPQVPTFAVDSWKKAVAVGYYRAESQMWVMPRYVQAVELDRQGVLDIYPKKVGTGSGTQGPKGDPGPPGPPGPAGVKGAAGAAGKDAPTPTRLIPEYD